MQHLVNTSWKAALLAAAVTCGVAGAQSAPIAAPATPGTETTAPVVGPGYLGVYLDGAADGGGVKIAEVVPNSPAAKAGLQAGDVLVAIADRTTASEDELRNAIASLGAGTKVKLTFLRDGEKRRTSARLAAPPEEMEEVSELDDTGGGGMDFVDITPVAPPPPLVPAAPMGGQGWLGVQLQPADGGASVLAVVDGSPAAGAGLQEGDMIVRVDGDDVDSVDALVSAIGSRKAGDKVRLVLMRDGEEKKLKVTLGARDGAVAGMGGGGAMSGGMPLIEESRAEATPPPPAPRRARIATGAGGGATAATNDRALNEAREQLDALRMQVEELRARCEQQQRTLDAIRAALGGGREPQPDSMPVPAPMAMPGSGMSMMFVPATPGGDSALAIGGMPGMAMAGGDGQLELVMVGDGGNGSGCGNCVAGGEGSGCGDGGASCVAGGEGSGCGSGAANCDAGGGSGGMTLTLNVGADGTVTSTNCDSGGGSCCTGTTGTVGSCCGEVTGTFAIEGAPEMHGLVLGNEGGTFQLITTDGDEAGTKSFVLAPGQYSVNTTDGAVKAKKVKSAKKAKAGAAQFQVVAPDGVWVEGAELQMERPAEFGRGEKVIKVKAAKPLQIKVGEPRNSANVRWLRPAQMKSESCGSGEGACCGKCSGCPAVAPKHSVHVKAHAAPAIQVAPKRAAIKLPHHAHAQVKGALGKLLELHGHGASEGDNVQVIVLDGSDADDVKVLHGLGGRLAPRLQGLKALKGLRLHGLGGMNATVSECPALAECCESDESCCESDESCCEEDEECCEEAESCCEEDEECEGNAEDHAFSFQIDGVDLDLGGLQFMIDDGSAAGCDDCDDDSDSDECDDCDEECEEDDDGR